MSGDIEKKTYRTHVVGAMFDGAYSSVIASAADVAVKNLGAGAYQVMVIHMAPGVVQLFTLLLGRVIESGSRRALFLAPALLGRLPIVALFFSGEPWFFTGLLVLQAMANVTIIPALNSIFRHNYRDENRGTLYSKASRYGQIVAGVALVGFGYWLDVDATAYRSVFPAAAILGIVACFIYAGMPGPRGTITSVGSVRPDVFFAFRILARDRLFLIYEVGFTLYGLAFMSALTAKSLFAVNDLHLSNMELLGARSIFSFMMVICTASMGRLLDKFNAAWLAASSFAVLAVNMTLLYFAQGSTEYFIAEAVFGLAMAGVTVAWNIGPVSFASAGESLQYMAVHVSLVGVRAIFGHPMGALMSDFLEPRLVFPVSTALLVAATFVMARVVPGLRARVASLANMT